VENNERVFRQFDGLALKEVGDFEALNFLPVRNEVEAGVPPQNLTRSTKLYLSNEPAFLPTPVSGSLLLHVVQIFSC